MLRPVVEGFGDIVEFQDRFKTDLNHFYSFILGSNLKASVLFNFIFLK